MIGRGPRRGHEARPRSAVRRVMALVGVAAVTAATFLALPTAAEAAGQNTAIVVGDITIAPADTQATVGDTLTVSGSWDASDADPHEGDTFTIGLPDELAFPASVPFNLSGPNGAGDTVTWATCLTDAGTGLATCTLTAEVEDFPELVKGAFEFDVTAIVATDEKDVVFDLNGTDVEVPLPGGGGIDDGLEPPSPWDKSGAMNSDHWSIGWTINLPGDRLVGNDALNIAETLSDDHRLCDPSGLKVVAIRGGSSSTVSDVATIVAGADDQHFTIHITEPAGGWDDKTTYRVTYNTCTPDGQIDPVGTEYTNEATIDVWGESSGVIGVTQDWDYHGKISKSGSVLGGADRNGKIAWTVTVDGDNLAGKTGIPFTERLSGAHALCSDTISGIRIYEQYGPSGSKRTEITDKVDVATVSSSAQAFSTTLSPKDGFAFRAHPYIYLITYATCATTDGLPEGGETFGNSASVAGGETSSDAKVPGRTDAKTGSINGSAVTLDGVEYLPQTTVGWKITVPGQDLVDVDSDLTVTDTLSQSLAVCEGSGGSAASRLGLKVQAVDQISGGGLATVDLTDSVTTAQNGNDLTFVIPQPTLTQPDGSTATGFSREYQYVISYTTCTASGGMDAPGTVYSNNAVVNGKTYTSSSRQNNSGSGTGQGVSRGSVAVVKHLADTAGADLVPADTTFTVHAKEIDPDGTVQKEYDLNVPLDGSPISGPNARGKGWKIQLSEPTMPKVPGVVFGDPVFTASDGVVVGDGGKTATATITPATNIDVTLTNTAQLGSLRVVKAIDGPAAARVPSGTEFPVTAHIDTSGLSGVPAQPDRSFTITDGTPAVLDDLPVGAVVTLTEGTPPAVDGVTWGAVAITGDGVEDAGDGSATVTVTGAQTDVSLTTVTNTAQWTPATFSLHKDVTGPGADLVPDDTRFTVHVKEIDPDGATKAEYDLSVHAGDNASVTARAASGPGWTLELSEPTFPDVPGTTFGDPAFTAADGVTVNGDGTVATATLTPGANTAVALTNTAQLGAVTVTKQVDGPASALVGAQQTYLVTAHIDVSGIDGDIPAQPDRTLTVTAGDPYTIDDLPIGAAVTFTEALPVDDDVLTWSQPTFSPATITLSADDATEAAVETVTNHVTRTVGTFSLSKTVTGAEAANAAVPAEVTVTATWDEEGAPGQKTLTLPTDGTPVPFGEDLLVGTKVTLTETVPSDGSGIAWGAPVWSGTGVAVDGASAIVTVGRDADAAVSVENHAATSTAGISLLKGVAGEAAGDVPADARFPVTASWFDAEGVLHTKELLIGSQEPTSLGEDLPYGTVVSLVEHDAPTADTVVWGHTVVLGDDVTDNGDGTATVTVSDQQGASTLVTVVNEATWAPGTLSVAKQVTGIAGDDPRVPDDVTVTANWIDADGADQSADLTVPTDGTVVSLGRQLPYGTQVTLTEQKPAADAAFTWDTPTWAGDVAAQADGSAVVTIGAATTSAATLTNHASPVRASVALTKKLSGPAAGDVPAGTTFPVTLSWTDLEGADQQRDVTLSAGEQTVIADLPVGTTIQVSEGETDLPDNVAWTGAAWTSADDAVTLTADGDAADLTLAADGTHAVTLTNAYVDPPVLPVTGLDGARTLALGALGVALLIGGAVLLAVRRRRTAK